VAPGGFARRTLTAYIAVNVQSIAGSGPCSAARGNSFTLVIWIAL
jgi:hypothetical protein